ncbi:MAG: hypothetical protein CM15mP74_29560 [Halieaceae bacterium]|nr:MAG: hypothetical protein CM15mP74_29560 [Halieaceae bacterium]
MYQSTIFGTSVRPLAPPKAVPRQSARSPAETVELNLLPSTRTPMMQLCPQPLWQHSRVLPHHIDVTNALEAVVDTATVIWIRGSTTSVDLAGIHKSVMPNWVASSFLSALRSTPIMRRADQLGTLNHVEANATQTEDGDGGTGLDLHREGDGTDAGGHPSRCSRSCRRARPLALCYGDLGQHGVIGKS